MKSPCFEDISDDADINAKLEESITIDRVQLTQTMVSSGKYLNQTEEDLLKTSENSFHEIR